MNNDVQQGAPCCLFQFEGELRADHVEGLAGLLGTGNGDDAGGLDPRHILVDCRRVVRFDDHALEALVNFQAQVEAAGGKVMLVGIGHPRLTNVVFLEENDTGTSLSGMA